MTVDIRQPAKSELASDHVKEMFDRLGSVKAVVKELGNSSWCGVWSALKHWHKVRGLPLPGLAKGSPKGRIDPKAKFRDKVDEIWATYQRKTPLGMIAREVGVSRPTVDKSIKLRAEELGITVPDGRQRRAESVAAGYRSKRRRRE